MYDLAKVSTVLAHGPYGLADQAKAARAVDIIAAGLKLYPALDIRFLAYCLATAFWETAWTLTPIAEIGHGRGKPYGVPNPATGQIYYGRGLVQTTWLSGYRTVGGLLKIDCVNHPDLLLQMQYAAPALFVGLVNGIYTGKRLAYYFNIHGEDPVNARRCVNGLDKAEAIAELYRHIKAALEAAKLPSAEAA